MANETRSQYHNEHHCEREPCTTWIVHGVTDSVGATAAVVEVVERNGMDRKDHDPRIIKNEAPLRACGKPRGVLSGLDDDLGVVIGKI